MEQVTTPDDRPEADGPRLPDPGAADPPTLPVTRIVKSGGLYRRITAFPNGSETHEEVNADGSAVVPVPVRTASWGAAAAARADSWVDVDQALRRLLAAQAGRLCHDGTGCWAFDGALWRREPPGTAGLTRRLRAAGVAAPSSTLVATVDGLARAELAADSHDADAYCNPDAYWDRDPWRLGTPGGTVDLATGALRAAVPADRITRATAIAPAETADCPTWRRFLDEAMAGDASRVEFLRRFCGYALTGETCEHVLLFALGEGGNGKSVFSNTLRTILGSYAAVAAPDLLTQGAGRRGGTAHSADVAMLAGARLVTGSETEEGRTWADGRLKLLTGGDPVTARRLGRDPFTFTPRFKLLVTGNHMPVLRTVDAALRRRLRVVPFTHTPAVPDRRLEARLRDEAPAILRWMIEGCLAWARSLDAPGEGGGEAGELGRNRPAGGGLVRPTRWPRRPTPISPARNSWASSSPNGATSTRPA